MKPDLEQQETYGTIEEEDDSSRDLKTRINKYCVTTHMKGGKFDRNEEEGSVAEEEEYKSPVKDKKRPEDYSPYKYHFMDNYYHSKRTANESQQSPIKQPYIKKNVNKH